MKSFKNLQDPERCTAAWKCLHGSFFFSFHYMRGFLMSAGLCTSVLVCGPITVAVLGLCVCTTACRLCMRLLLILQIAYCGLSFCIEWKQFMEL